MNHHAAAALEALRLKLEAETPAPAFSVGDILYSSWGYDQTNVEFYQVVAVSSKGGLSIREISQRVVGGEGSPSEQVMPKPGDFIGPVMKKRPSPHGSVKLTSFSRAYKWDGKPKHQTGSGWGH